MEKRETNYEQCYSTYDGEYRCYERLIDLKNKEDFNKKLNLILEKKLENEFETEDTILLNDYLEKSDFNYLKDKMLNYIINSEHENKLEEIKDTFINFNIYFQITKVRKTLLGSTQYKFEIFSKYCDNNFFQKYDEFEILF